MFLMKAESTVTVSNRSSICARTDSRLGKKRLMARSTTPDRATPALTTSAEPTMMTMSSEKPANASAGETRPRATDETSAAQATTSYRNRSHKKTAIMAAMTLKARICS
ncbi:hypothetical protein PDO_2885 [Rhizobium sp. PDO1-076]|nr:hypothetical protein PDO_2885 [Rhizobium sp. PDO1-076]